MRAVAALMIFGLAACQVLFKLENLPDGPPDADLRPTACKHEGLLLCLAFEDDPTDGTADESSGRGLITATTNVTSIERAPGELAINVTSGSSVVVQGSAAEPGGTALDLPTPVTFDLWVNYAGPLATRQVVLDNEFQYGVQVSTDAEFPDPENLGCGFVFPTGMAPPKELAFREINAPAAREMWHHVACVYDGTNLQMYLDSVVINQTASGPLSGSATNFLNVGRAGSVGDPRNVTGQIDNVRVWNRALSANDVQLIFMGNEPLVP